MKSAGFVVAGILIIGIGEAILAGQVGAGAPEKQGKGLKKEPITYSKPESGAQMFKDYCAACHGPDGKGDGPAVPFLKSPPANLRTLAQRNGGKYPDNKVASILRFGGSSQAHGTSDMPVWGPLFRSQDRDQKVPELRIHNLTSFVGSLQEK